MQHKQPKFSGILVVAVLMVLVLFFVSLSPLLAASATKGTTYSEIYYYFENQQVTSFRLDLGTGSLEDAINANTKALEKTNSALADMIRQAGSLVLSDNMRLGSTVAASGTAQVVSAANSYHREGDTNITQNIYSKAQTAADLQREARWEADRAKAQRR